MNACSRSGVIGPPIKSSVKPVWPSTGAMQLTRIFIGASSTAIDLETRFTNPFEPLYQVSPGRGRTPAVEPMLMTEPPPPSRKIGVVARVIR